MAQNDDAPSPPMWKFLIVKWMGLFPTILVFAYTSKMIGIEPMWLKMLIESVVLVPLLAYVITPFMDTVFSEWLYKGIDPEQQRKSINIGR